MDEIAKLRGDLEKLKKLGPTLESNNGITGLRRLIAELERDLSRTDSMHKSMGVGGNTGQAAGGGNAPANTVRPGNGGSAVEKVRDLSRQTEHDTVTLHLSPPVAFSFCPLCPSFIYIHTLIYIYPYIYLHAHIHTYIANLGNESSRPIEHHTDGDTGGSLWAVRAWVEEPRSRS